MTRRQLLDKMTEILLRTDSSWPSLTYRLAEHSLDIQKAVIL